MRVSGLTATGDWQFGRGKASYLVNSAAIRQNVVTRLRSFTNDWALDINHGSDWFSILGQHGNEKRLLDEVNNVVLTTDGVRAIEKIEVLSTANRVANILVRYVDIFDVPTTETVSLP